MGLQYIQLILGYAPLKAAVSLLPIAAVVLPLSVIAPKIAERLGYRTVVGTGLCLVTAGFVLMARLEPASTYRDLLVGLLIFSAGLALAATPATNTIISALPPEKQGVASAMNDLSLGSLFAAGYRNALSLPPDLPARAVATARESPAAGIYVAANPALGPLATPTTTTVREAFMTGMTHAFTTGAAITAVAVPVLLLVGRTRRSSLPIPPQRSTHF